jgi:hypothetical protein
VPEPRRWERPSCSTHVAICSANAVWMGHGWLLPHRRDALWFISICPRALAVAMGRSSQSVKFGAVILSSYHPDGVARHDEDADGDKDEEEEEDGAV